jgi:hypothetical protein
VETAIAANAKQLFFYHHDPQRTDEGLARIERRWQQHTPGNSGPKIFAAKEGEVIVV